MNVLQKIGKFEAIALIVMVSMNQIFLNLSNIIIVNTGTSAWINVIVISIIALLFCLLISKLFKPFPTKDIVDISIGDKVIGLDSEGRVITETDTINSETIQKWKLF